VLLSDDLSNRQTEFSIGYGKELADAWSVGGTLKLQNHSLAGFSGSGVGIDVGVMVKPLLVLSPNHRNAQRYTVGVALRNALEPKIRLAGESVPDPVGLRIGVAAQLPFWQGHEVLAAMDLEKTSRMDTRLHAGLEVTVNQNLVLRIGADDGAFRTGFGVGWRNMDVSYAFENTSLGGVNRFGLAVAFGPTVVESRQAAIDVEERKLQAAIDEAFAQRQAARVRDMLTQCEDALQQGIPSEALNILAAIDALDPGNKRAQVMQKQILNQAAKRHEINGEYADATVMYSRVLKLAPEDPVAKAGYRRAKEAGDSHAQRSALIRAYFEGALSAFGEQKLGEARNGFSVIIEMSPNDREAATMLERTNEAIARRCGELLVQAERFTGWGYFDEAEDALAEVRNLNDRSDGLARAEMKLRNAKVKRQTRATRTTAAADTSRGEDGATVKQAVPDNARSPLTDSQRREVERLYESGTVALEAGRAEDAIRYLELVWSMDPTYRRAAEYLKREYLTKGMEYFADGDMDRAQEIWEKALRVDPTDQRTLGYLSRVREQRVRTKEIFGQNR
jgi:tetratricopeptide (TPR) repeat protein